MKALSVRQPWASLIVAGIKPVENRTWATRYRGPLLIHAAQGYDHAGQAALEDHDLYAGYYHHYSPERVPRGAIIGQADLTDCVQGHSSSWAEPGAWHWVLANPMAFDEPTPYKGRLGLFDVVMEG